MWENPWQWTGWAASALIGAAYVRLFRSTSGRNLRRMERALAEGAQCIKDQDKRIAELDEVVERLRTANDHQAVNADRIQTQNLDLLADKRKLLQALDLKNHAITRLIADMGHQEKKLRKAMEDIENLSRELTKIKATYGIL